MGQRKEPFLVPILLRHCWEELTKEAGKQVQALAVQQILGRYFDVCMLLVSVCRRLTVLGANLQGE
jgi:hypothetical protein